jgi:general secretion pathway protein K
VLTNGRKSGCFPDVQTFNNVATSFAGPKALANMNPVGTQSSYFLLTTRVTLGTTEFTLYSLLYRGSAKITPLLRSFGTL